MKKIIPILFFVSVFMLITIFSARQVPAGIKEAIDLYNKGIDAMEQNNCQEARNYFTEAIKHKTKDSQRLRIQGTYFVSYLPNTKLKELEKICSSEDAVVPKPIDRTPETYRRPLLTISHPKQEKTLCPYEQESVLIKGKISNGHGKVAVTINGGIIYPEKNGEFNEEIKLNPNENNVVIRAEDEKRQYDERKFQFIREPPPIVVEDTHQPMFITLDHDGGEVIRTKERYVRISGRVTGGKGRLSVTVNGSQVTPEKNGKFQTYLPVSGEQVIEIHAEDQNGKKAIPRYVQLISEIVSPPIEPHKNNLDIDYGPCYALVIGINNYKHLPMLKTAVNDAKEIGEVLKNDYGFKTEVLFDPNRSQILRTLHKLRNNLTKKDNLLIYYAGHGWLEEKINEAYWLPTDAESGDDSINGISSASLVTEIKGIRAKHVLVVSDSCYSGSMVTRGIEDPDKSLIRLSQKKARRFMASGSKEPVADAGGKGLHSVFASAFLDALEENQGILNGTEIFNEVRGIVIPNAYQTPEYAPIHMAGHEGGDFLFIRRNK